MKNLPFIDVDRELHFNLGVALIVLNQLAITSKEKRVLNLDKFQLFFSLATTPFILDKVLRDWGCQGLEMDENEFYMVRSNSGRYEDFFDLKKSKLLLRVLVLRQMVSITHSRIDGFLFELNEKGNSIAEQLTNENYSLVQKYVERIRFLQSKSTSKIKTSIFQHTRGSVYVWG